MDFTHDFHRIHKEGQPVQIPVLVEHKGHIAWIDDLRLFFQDVACPELAFEDINKAVALGLKEQEGCSSDIPSFSQSQSCGTSNNLHLRFYQC